MDTIQLDFQFSSSNYGSKTISSKKLIVGDTLFVSSYMTPVVPSEEFLKIQRQIEQWRKNWNKKIEDYPYTHTSDGTLLIDLSEEELRIYLDSMGIDSIGL